MKIETITATDIATNVEPETRSSQMDHDLYSDQHALPIVEWKAYIEEGVWISLQLNEDVIKCINSIEWAACNDDGERVEGGLEDVIEVALRMAGRRNSRIAEVSQYASLIMCHFSHWAYMNEESQLHAWKEYRIAEEIAA